MLTGLIVIHPLLPPLLLMLGQLVGQLVHVIGKADPVLGGRYRQVKELDIKLGGLLLDFRLSPQFGCLKRLDAGDMGFLIRPVSQSTGDLLGKLQTVGGGQAMVLVLDRSFARLGIDDQVLRFPGCWLGGWASGGSTGVGITSGARVLFALALRLCRWPGRR